MNITTWSWAVRLAALVPLLAGGAGALTGLGFLGATLPADADSHARYLSGLLLGIGLVALWCAQAPLARGQAFSLLTALVVVGGLARALGWLLGGPPPLPHQLALVMELGVVPALWVWRARLG
jgi:uncharacterized membrane protein